MIPAGAELAVAQQLEELLSSDHGQDLIAAAFWRSQDEEGRPRAVRELAAWLAERLIHGGS